MKTNEGEYIHWHEINIFHIYSELQSDAYSCNVYVQQSRAKSRPKLVLQQAEEYDDNTETVFKHYDNKFFDLHEAGLPKQGSIASSIPVPSMEIHVRKTSLPINVSVASPFL